MLLEYSVWMFAALAVFETTESKLAPTVLLNNGYKIPIVGDGTYLSKGNEVEQAVKDAIDVDYRHIDTAYIYQNEVEVGKAIREKIAEGVIKREDIFVTTKLWNTFHEPDQVEIAFNKSLENLDLEYIDLYLMHFPNAWQRILKEPSLDPNDVDSYQLTPQDENGKLLTANVDYVDTWVAMEKLVASGRVRSLGISNF
ncbi:putative aldo-keto reductase family 1 member C8, partial [Sitodiplosis mosellana]|uniref:putative aldo-keto reductase family 1 member C8 n=1 Tax=Sitodiplosis mosellana TaxID=263140 RepID=UPI0024448784